LSDAQRLSRAAAAAAAALFAALPQRAAVETGRRPLPDAKLPPALRERCEAFEVALDALYQHARGAAYESESIAQVARRIHRLREDLDAISREDAACVRWVETRGRRGALGASPVEVSEILRERLFLEQKPVVLTSATLSTGEDFAFTKQRLGIDFPIEEQRLASPFEYAEQAALYLPTHLPEPRSEAYVERAAEEILALTELTRGGAFVLCTSLRMMQRLYEACLPGLRGAALVQGMAPKGELLETFKARGDAVLFASNSFWEGIDVPGSALRLVIIDKLPFDVPTDPLVSARCARMQARGEQPFMDYLVPSAALSLKQGFGRLIRTRRDRGIVAILDRRIATKGYGRVLLQSLPDAARCYFPEEVRAFWEA
jgi:ATP-dependent DNA helicase DinG